ncbi:MAG: DUF465 domain-containing protein [Acetobacterales bacterium]
MAQDERALRTKLAELKSEHRDLDQIIAKLGEDHATNQLMIQRMKKRKLVLRDQIAWIEDQINPDIIA